MHDSLTGLPNRGLLLDRLGHALAVARRDASTVAVLFADLDRFMLVLESLGHQLGDEMIVAVAARWDQTLRASDTVGRLSADTMACLGGDQFVVLSEGLTSERDAIRIAERMAEALHEPFVVGGEQVFASASIGIALSSANDTPDSLLGDAGAAMERAKERGRGRYELADEAMRTRVGDRLRRENELRRAIEQDELRLHYQPIVSLADHRVIAAEALVRWKHPERGILAPGEFIGLAEGGGLIVPLGSWVLREACRQIALWEQSFGKRLGVPISINVSARQLANAQIVEEVKQAVSESGIDPGHLALEITETVLMEDGDTPVATLEALKQIGTPLVLDDFGTGYSSLSYLGRLPLDVLKLDRSFVAPLGPGGKGREIAAAVVELAHALEMAIVGEGVETEGQLEALQDLGFDLAQGYLFARPMPATEMTDLISAAAGGGTLRTTTPSTPQRRPSTGRGRRIQTSGPCV